MPAYDVNGVYAIFFIVYMLINLYIFINIILATIYTNYKKHLKDEVKFSLEIKRDKIKDAFNLIKFPLRELAEYEKKIRSLSLSSPPPPLTLEEQGNPPRPPSPTSTAAIEFKITELVRSEFEFVINYNVFTKLMKCVDAQKYTKKQIKILFDILDIDKNGLLCKFRKYKSSFSVFLFINFI